MLSERESEVPAAFERPALPLVPMVAPLVLAVVMALMFRSPLALMMGVLGPLMVWGGWWESVRQARVRHRRESDDALAASALVAKRIREHRSALREGLCAAYPSVLEWSRDALWRGVTPGDTRARIGLSWWEPPPGHPLEGSGGIPAVPAVVDTSAGLALVATKDQIGVWRALLLQWCAHAERGLIPASLDLGEGIIRDARGPSRLLWVAHISEVPPECAVVVLHEQGTRASLLTQGAAPLALHLDSLSQAEALWALGVLSPQRDQHAPPCAPDTTRRDQLWARLSPEGPLLDVVLEGPHTIVWGATGSGKSVTVVSLVASLAAWYTPRQLVCVVVDFKGGAGLQPLRTLPHTVGFVTDLDHIPSDRALRGLRAEVVRRERLLAAHSVPEIGLLAPEIECPRLVVVIDEVAWLFTNHPEWAEGLSDIVARGRSLGIHVVLSTQRLAGVVTRAMMANISLRLCGRISDEGEVAHWMPDSDAALVATMRHLHPGQVVISGSSLMPRLTSVSQQSAAAGPHPPSGWRVWGEPLGEVIPWSRGTWALREDVAAQAHVLAPNPLSRGSVMVMGDAGSGRSSSAAALVADAPHAVWAPPNAAGAWCALLEAQERGSIVVLDDAAMLLQAAGAEGESFLLEAIQGFPGTLVMTGSPHQRLGRALSRLVPQVVVLSIAKPEDRDIWGSPQRAVPGAGVWEGNEIHVTYPAPRPPVWEVPPVHVMAPPIVITQEPGTWQDIETEAVLSPEDSLGWITLAGRRSVCDVVLEGIGHREARLVTQGALWIPPLAPPPGWVWLWRGGTPRLANSADWRR